jgi:muramoyltetrapeptide carboxypeptidase
MASAFNDGGATNEYVQSLQKALFGKKAKYKCDGYHLNQPGEATAELVGGNLTLLAHLTGTKSDINTKDKILFIEDIGEYIYNIDRMLLQLKRSGKLSGLSGLVIGGFTDIKDTERPFGKTVYAAISDLVKEYTYPVCFQFPVSHETENYALKIGVTYKLKIGKKTVQLSEL